jgi:hypothetical protein
MPRLPRAFVEMTRHRKARSLHTADRRTLVKRYFVIHKHQVTSARALTPTAIQTSSHISPEVPQSELRIVVSW